MGQARRTKNVLWSESCLIAHLYAAMNVVSCIFISHVILGHVISNQPM